MQIKILGKKWTLRFLPNLGKNHGTCDHPNKPHKEIRIEQGLKDMDKLEIIIHELTHAAFWHLDEEFVERFAADVAKILTDIGYKLDP